MQSVAFPVSRLLGNQYTSCENWENTLSQGHTNMIFMRYSTMCPCPLPSMWIMCTNNIFIWGPQKGFSFVVYRNTAWLYDASFWQIPNHMIVYVGNMFIRTVVRMQRFCLFLTKAKSYQCWCLSGSKSTLSFYGKHDNTIENVSPDQQVISYNSWRMSITRKKVQCYTNKYSGDMILITYKRHTMAHDQIIYNGNTWEKVYEV